MRGKKVDICIFDAAKLNSSTWISLFVSSIRGREKSSSNGFKPFKHQTVENCLISYSVRTQPHRTRLHNTNKSLEERERKNREVARRTRKTYIHNCEWSKEKTWSKMCLTFITVFVTFFLYFRLGSVCSLFASRFFSHLRCTFSVQARESLILISAARLSEHISCLKYSLCVCNSQVTT